MLSRADASLGGEILEYMWCEPNGLNVRHKILQHAPASRAKPTRLDWLGVRVAPIAIKGSCPESRPS